MSICSATPKWPVSSSPATTSSSRNCPPGSTSPSPPSSTLWTYNPGDAITEAVPELWQVLDHPTVTGALVSLLGPDYEVQSHRHWHCKQPNSPHMNWHQDGLNNRDVLLNRFLGLYYPTDVTPDMGPTIIVPGTQFRNAPTDRMATYTNIRGQVPLVVKAGTVAFTHYDLWHGTAANRSLHKRHMIKFLFRRTQDNTAPTWNHDPRGGQQTRRLERARPGRGRHQHPQLHQSAGRLPERPLQGTRHPPPELELSHGPVGLIPKAFYGYYPASICVHLRPSASICVHLRITNPNP